jgi:hypothetical protein
MRQHLILATTLLAAIGSSALAQTGTDAASPNGAAAVSGKAASANAARSKPAARKTHNTKAKPKSPSASNATGGADSGASPSGPG